MTEDGFVDRVLYEVEDKRPLDVPRKKFLIDLAHEVFSRLFSLPPDGLRGVVEAVGGAAGAGDLQAWFADPAWQAEIAGTTLEGALPEARGDFLLLADTNMSQGKANADLVRLVNYKVHRQPGGDLEATLEIDYRNEGSKSWRNPYYNGFLRIYVPKGAQLLDDGEAESTVADAPDGPYQVISLRIFVPPRDDNRVSLTYRLPRGLARDGRYHLTWLRQAGTPADRLTATVGTSTYVADPAQRRLEAAAELP